MEDCLLELLEAPEETTTMSLNQADHKENRPSFWERIKESFPVLIVTVAGGFVLHWYLPSQIISQTSGLANDISSLKTDMSTVKSGLDEVRKDIKDSLNKALERAYQGIPARPIANTRGSLNLGNTAIELANDFKVPLDATVNNGFGLKAIAASRDPELRTIAWRGVELSLGQRTTQPMVRQLVDEKHWIYFGSNRDLGPLLVGDFAKKVLEGLRLSVSETRVPFGRCPLFIPVFDEPPRSAEFKDCAEYVLAEGRGHSSTVILDGIHARNVIYRNARITYGGGPVILENVAFLDCEFDFPINIKTEKFAMLMLQSKEVSFKQLS